MKLVVFGASGGTGRHFIEQAVVAGHEVTAVVRDPTKLANPHRDVVTADVMDPEAISPILAGQNAIISALGTRERGPTSVQTDSTRSIISAMKTSGTRRLLVVSNSGMFTEGDGALTKTLVKPLLRRLLKHGWADMRRMEDLVHASGLDWTIMRPPMLTEGSRTGTYRTERNRNVRGGIRISRADLADSMLHSLADPQTINAAIAVGN